MMALYFTNLSALLKIGGFMFFIAAALVWLWKLAAASRGRFSARRRKKISVTCPQTELADEGEKIIFGGVGQNKVQGAIGKGQCPLCHAFHEGMLGERAPNLDGLPERAGKERRKIPRTIRVIRLLVIPTKKKHFLGPARLRMAKNTLRNLIHARVALSCQAMA